MPTDKLPRFVIVLRQPTTYLDKGGEAISGYRIRFDVPAFDEIHEVQVASLDPKIVKAAINEVVDQIEATNKLGS